MVTLKFRAAKTTVLPNGQSGITRPLLLCKDHQFSHNKLYRRPTTESNLKELVSLVVLVAALVQAAAL